MERCKKCGVELKKETPQMNGYCVDCFADDLGELVEKYPPVPGVEERMRHNEK